MGAPGIRESERWRPPERDAGTWAPAEGALRQGVDAHVIGVGADRCSQPRSSGPPGKVNGGLDGWRRSSDASPEADRAVSSGLGPVTLPAPRGGGERTDMYFASRMPCAECGAVVERADAAAHVCDPARWRDFQCSPCRHGRRLRHRPPGGPRRAGGPLRGLAGGPRRTTQRLTVVRAGRAALAVGPDATCPILLRRARVQVRRCTRRRGRPLPETVRRTGRPGEGRRCVSREGPPRPRHAEDLVPASRGP